MKRLRIFVALLLGSTLAAYAQRPVTGAHVMDLTRQFLDAAPKRFGGSPGHAKAEEFIKAHFAPEAAKGNFITDEFYANTPIGHVPLRNLIVKFPGKTAPAPRHCLSR